MTALDDGAGLSALTIPGTHDSAARHGSPRARTQNLDIAGQLARGIRFLDVRLKDTRGVLRLYHGTVDQRLEFAAGVVAPVLEFLGLHPGETVIMSVKQEDDGDPLVFAADFERLLAAQPTSFHLATELPSLADARGRIVLLRRFAGSELGIPAGPADWLNNATFQIAAPGGILAIEDQWEVAGPLPWQLDDKWTAIAQNLDAAAAAPGAWHITFTSATSDFCWPQAIAEGLPLIDGMNRRLLSYLADHAEPRRLGTIVMDFPDGPLIQRLIDTNVAA